MRISRYALPCVALILAWGSSLAHASVGQLRCEFSSGPVTANLSYFDLGFNISGVTAAGAVKGAGGKVVDTPLEIHTSLVNFQKFFDAIERGEHARSCILTTQTGGNEIGYTFSDVSVISLDAIAQNPRNVEGAPIAYLDIKLVYNRVMVRTTLTEDDGGSAS
jgi:hypothetical protein